MNTETRIELTDQQFALLGGGEVGYIREIGSAEALKLLGPRVANLPDNAKLFCLHGADGSPISISGTRDAALATAFQNDIAPVSVH